jgi:hypothetical protein
MNLLSIGEMTVMIKFYHAVDRRSRKAMTEYLSGHFRYNTMNSWNCSTSYAQNLKIYNLGLDSVITDKLYSLIQIPAFYETLKNLMFEFGEEHDYRWQAGMNGRSGGYLVLYQGRTERNRAVSYPGRSTDMDEDFGEWTLSQLRDRTETVQSFDKLADAIVVEALWLAKHYTVEEETIFIEKTRPVLVPVS